MTAMILVEVWILLAPYFPVPIILLKFSSAVKVKSLFAPWIAFRGRNDVIDSFCQVFD